MKRFLKILLLLVLLVLLGNLLLKNILPGGNVLKLAATEIPDWIDRQIIDVDGDSRRGVPLEDIRDIVIHYVGNPGTTAQQNRDYYANPESEVSSHFKGGDFRAEGQPARSQGSPESKSQRSDTDHPGKPESE